MPSYYVDRRPQADGHHQVHAQGCPYLPLYRLHLGDFVQGAAALREAQRHYAPAAACRHCGGGDPRRA